jgi:malate dehydrogenase
MVKIGFVGAGRIGQTLTYSTLLSGISEEATIFDIVPNLPQRFKDELLHALAASHINIKLSATNSLDEVKDNDIIVISAGKPRQPNQDRTAVFSDNAKIMIEFAKVLPKNNPNALFLVVTNPVDQMASVFMKYSNKFTISSGAQVENMRLRSFIADRLGVPVDRINGFVGGEHGERLSVFWDTVTVNGAPFDRAASGKLTREEVTLYVKGVAAQVIATLGGTSWGPATSIRDIIVAFATNENRVMSIAAPLKYKDEVIHMSRPTVVGNVIGPTLEASLSLDDQKLLNSAADNMYNEYKDLLKKLV